MTLVYPADDFEAFLTAVLETWVNHAPEWTIVAETNDWFGPEGPWRPVKADSQAARRIADGVTRCAGPQAWFTVGAAFRHSDSGKETLLAGFIRLCVRHGRQTVQRLVDPGVRETLRRARAVQAEAHRFLGLVRFQAVEGGWYGCFEPDHDVLGMLVGSFHQRMLGTDWMLHDPSRETAWVCRSGKGEAVFGVRMTGKGATAGESQVQELWKQYFKTIALPTRINPTLQRSKIPLKTWKNLIEEPGRF